MYCLTHKGAKDIGFTAMHEKDEKGNPRPETFNYDFWVCSLCMKPTRMVFTAMTGNLAPFGATAILNATSPDGDGRWYLQWGTAVSGERIETMTFFPYPRGNQMDHGRGVLVELWERLDLKIDTIRAGKTIDLEYAKAQATELADIIAVLMPKFYESGKAVLQESMTRWEKRQAGSADSHVTPGLAEHNWSPPTMAYAPEHKVAPPVQIKKLDEQKVTFIKHCLQNGLQTPEALASMFDVSIETIRTVVDG